MADLQGIALKNPDYGASIIDFPSQGKKWTIMAGDTLLFPPLVAKDLSKTYAFLQEVDVPELPSENSFLCSECKFRANKKIAVLGHLRKHGDKGEVIFEEKRTIQKAISTGDVVPNLTIAEARVVKTSPDLPSGRDKDGVEWYGDTVPAEEKPASRNIRGTPGHFGAAT